MKFLKLLLVPLVALALLVAGCQTTGTSGDSINLDKVLLVSKLAAYNGTFLYVSKHPEAKDKFVLASASLGALVDNGVTVQGLVAILDGLPIKQLDSTEGKVLINSAVIIFGSYFNSTEVKFNELEKVKDLHLVASALKEGIDQGLAGVK